MYRNIVRVSLISFALTSCVLHQSQFALPDQVHFKDKTFTKVTSNQIDEMQQMLYLPENGSKNPEDWQQGILFFLDKNGQAKTLQQRAQLREQAFAKQLNTEAKVAIAQNELQSQVIYPPTERFNDVMLEVSRGRDSQCGYGQIQFSDKRSVAAKNLQNLTAYQKTLSELALEFAKLPWLIECKG
ncbi:ABC transporter ATPase [Pasteurellaceae bacterium 15-036681]|nr:ABC transporter ATPase [Pasteurellaceae bacterium 15-036681]